MFVDLEADIRVRLVEARYPVSGAGFWQSTYTTAFINIK